MKIKNIRSYRTLYKEKIRKESSKDENFIGTYYYDESKEKQCGWFDIYHGDKEGYGEVEVGIANFLQSFLDMAKDGQAVYEFLQNAVDAGSTHFSMFWEEDAINHCKYVMIANNGSMFGFNNIRSILNVGSSTKTTDSQSIGKFGIGFKLAHRLVGKENGLNELLHDYSGPILFSWNNGELEQLSEGEELEPVDVELEKIGQNGYECKDTSPWLFKILITCFPCLPENKKVTETVRLIDGKEAENSLFTNDEYKTLSRWVKNYKDVLNSADYREGSIIFIKLGEGKETDLADQNLAQGIKFSLAILQETSEKRETRVLKKVQLNRNDTIEFPELSYLRFYITKEQNIEDYLYVRFGLRQFEELSQEQIAKFNKEEDIEVLFGFRTYDQIGDYFKGAPNFYLYFPLSEEVHNFNFILHSNAFYKASSRTFLHKGTQDEEGINERLLKTIAQKVGVQLTELWQSEEVADNKKFLDLYAALLTSNKSDIQDRQWIQKPFVEEVERILVQFIPVKSDVSPRYEIETSNKLVKIKDTALNFSKEKFLPDIRWFYYDEAVVVRNAITKIELDTFDIYDLLSIPLIYDELNIWIKDDVHIQRILSELDQKHEQTRAYSSDFKTNLCELEIFRFSDGVKMSMNELVKKQNEGYLIRYNKLSEINELLFICGIKTTFIDFNSYQFVKNFSSYFSTDSQLRGYNKLVEIFNLNLTEERVDRLSIQEKLKIFTAFRDLNDENKIQRVKELKLYRNKSNTLVCIKNLLLETPFYWLKSFEIRENEFSPELKSYLQNEQKEYYENIILPFWKEILSIIIKEAAQQQDVILQEIIQLYGICDSKDKKTLGNIIPFCREVKESVTVFTHPKLVETALDEYEKIQQVLQQVWGVFLPDHFYLPYCTLLPFKVEKEDIQPFHQEQRLEMQQIRTLLIFCRRCQIQIFDEYVIISDQDTYVLRAKKKEEIVYFSALEKVQNYIKCHHADSFICLPDVFKEFEDLVVYREKKLYSELVNLLSGSPSLRLELLDVLLKKTEIYKELFDKFSVVTLDVNWDKEAENKLYLTFLKELLNSEEITLQDIYKIIVLADEDRLIYLKDVEKANDEILLDYEGAHIKLSQSKLLNLEEGDEISIIQEFAKESIRRNILIEPEVIKLFKIENVNITASLVSLFLEKIQGGKLENAHQLFFAFGYDSFTEEQMASFRIKSHSDGWRKVEGNWVLNQENPLYKQEYVLSSIYQGLDKLLDFASFGILYCKSKEKENEDNWCCIYPEFKFQAGCSINVFNLQADVTPLLNYLVQSWKATHNNKRISSISSWSWEKCLGFKPEEKIDASHIISSENLSKEMTEWIDEKEENRKFASSLGIYPNNSEIVRLREWLLGVTEKPQCVELDMSSYFLKNTLLGLADGFIDEMRMKSYMANSERSKVVNKIIEKVFQEYEQGIPLPLFETVDRYILGGKERGLLSFIAKDILELLLEDAKNYSYLNDFFQQSSIVVWQDEYQDVIKKHTQELQLSFEFSNQNEAVEHAEFYYKKWSDSLNIHLLKISEIKEDVYVFLDGKKINLGKIKRKTHWIEENQGVIRVYYLQGNGLEELRKTIENVKLCDAIKRLIDKREQLLLTLSDSSGDTHFNALLQEQINQRSIEEERRTILDTIEANKRYSYKWFVGYLEYLRTFEEVADTVSQRSITFQQIIPFINNEGCVLTKYYLLKGANSLIPINIESFCDFKISICWGNRRREEIRVEGVSRRGLDLLIYCPTGIKDDLVDKLGQVIHITIAFTPVLNLLEKLHSEFVNQDVLTPWENIKEAAPAVHFIYGPPGTGKTTKLCDLLLAAYQANNGVRVLILTPTNKAADVLVKRILQKKTDLAIIRIGNMTDPELDESIYSPTLNSDLLKDTNIVVSTIHRLPYYQIEQEAGESFRMYAAHWDYVLFDEASMISLPYIAFALQVIKRMNARTQIIIAGDPKQIPPVVDINDKELETLDVLDENVYKMFGISDFNPHKKQTLRTDDSIDYLERQYRSVEEIGELFSSLSYNGLITHVRDYNMKPRKKLPDSFIEQLKYPVTFVDVPLNNENSIAMPRKLLYSSYHLYSAILAAELIKHLDTCLGVNDFYRIGLISPYKAQALIMNKLVTFMGISGRLDVRCDTIHGFQGDECDIIIFVVNPNNFYYTGHKNSLLSKEYIYNVAISRAQDYLWIINPFQFGNKYINDIKNMGAFEVVNSSDIENQLFGQSDFILRNSYLTGHDNINVFGLVEMSYFIKAGENAIDIQLKR